jgi:hypothetical protein
VQESIERAPVERALEGVRSLKELTQLRGDVHGTFGRHRPCADHLRRFRPSRYSIAMKKYGPCVP